MSVLLLRVLGTLALELPGGPAAGAAVQRRPLALLAALAVAGPRGMSRERLQTLLWPERDVEQTRGVLNQTLYALRRDTGVRDLGDAGPVLALSPDTLACDLWTFERAAAAGDVDAALAAYGGPLLDGVTLPRAREFEWWLETERGKVAGRLAQLLADGIAEATRAGDHARAAALWARQAAAAPLDDRVTLAWMQALVAAGDRMGALRVAGRYADQAQADPDTTPSAAVLTYIDHLRRARTPAPPPAGGEILTARSAVPVAILADAPATASTTAPPAAPRDDGPGAGPVRGARRSPRAWWAAVLATAAVALLAAWELQLDRGPSRRAGAVADSAGGAVAPAVDPRRLAVLYFDDHSPGRTLGYLADGLTEELITALSDVPGLAVTSRNAVKPYRARAVSFDSLATALRVGSVVEGSVQTSRGQLRVTVQLIDAASGVHLGSHTFERPMQELFALQRDVSEQVAVFLRQRLGQEVRVREIAQDGQDPQALDAVLRAERLRKDAALLAGPSHARVESADLASADATYARADSLLAAAVRQSPRWTRPVVARGWVALDRAALLPEPERAPLLQSALAQAAQAVTLDRRSADALELRGTARWKLIWLALPRSDAAMDGAEADLRAALALDTLRAGTWATLSDMLTVRGALAEADALAQRALAMDAYLENRGDVAAQLVFSALARGDAPRAREWCVRGRAVEPTDWRFVECELSLMRLDLGAASPARAWALVRQLDALDPAAAARAVGRPYCSVYRRLVAAAVSARAGDAARARAELARALRETAADATLRMDVKYDAAFLHLALGDRAAAERLVGEYLAARTELWSYLRRDPAFAALGLNLAGVVDRLALAPVATLTGPRPVEGAVAGIPRE